MTHPGEQFYPQGVRWDDPIARGTLPDLLSKAASEYGARPAIEFRDRADQLRASWKRWSRSRHRAFLRAGYGRNHSVALFLGNSPDHPVNFFGALKAGARVVHLSPLDGERALSHKLSDSGARILVTSDLAALLPMALKFLDKGLLDRLIVCEDDHWGAVGNPHAPIPDHPAIVTYKTFVQGAARPAQWPVVSVDDVALLQYTGGTTGLPKGAMLSHGNLTSAVSIYDVWGRKARAERGGAIERVICVLPLFHIFALTVILLPCLEHGDLISLHQRFDVDAVMRDIEVKRATAFPGVPTMWIAIASLPDLDSRDLSSLVSCRSGGAPLPVEVARIFERKTRHEAQERLGHDRDLFARHRPSAGRTGQARLDRVDAARHRAGRGRARRSQEGACRRRSRRNPHQGTERHQGLLEPAEGDRGGVRRRPLPDRRHRLHGQRRLFLPGRPQEGHDHLRRLQRLSADDRAGDLRAPRGAGSHRDRHSRRLSRRGGQGLCQIARRRRAVHAGGAQDVSRRQARQARNSGGAGFRRRAAAHHGRKTLAPRIAQPAIGAAAEAATGCGRPGMDRSATLHGRCRDGDYAPESDSSVRRTSPNRYSRWERGPTSL